MRFKRWYFGLAIGFISLGELSLRGLGFGNPTLMQADAETGYRFVPNQVVYRFGHRIEYNQFSQRSEPIKPEKSLGTLRVLMAGDSVLNGNNTTDQKQTISELLEAQLQVAGQQAEVLNASAGSWGIGNQLGYFRKFGFFNSDAVILQIGTHDLLQPMSESGGVGKTPLMPDKKPLLAIQEVFDRHILPAFKNRLRTPSPAPSRSPRPDLEKFAENMQQLQEIIARCRGQNLPIFILYTPDRRDLIPLPNSPPFKSEFLQQMEQLKVPVIDVHAAWSNLPRTTVETFFRDGVHPTVAGYESITEVLWQFCQSGPGKKEFCTQKTGSS